ncbi:unnamed protein product [Orchesella dallaii]|uniref:SCP domain-containing protein n=1 Tax=Orchesella dallaii TaxID=48710 RepID=A0ABP1RIL9_9HEXA
MNSKKFSCAIYLAAAVFLFQAQFCSTQTSAAEYQILALNLINQARAQHHVNPLTLTDMLNQMATLCAQYYAEKGLIDHTCSYRTTVGAGENLYMIPSVSRLPDQDVTESIKLWYNEVSKYNFNGDWDPNAGHFTQLVWAGSQTVGYGLGRANGNTVGVALFYPPGNVLTQFKQNVFPA